MTDRTYPDPKELAASIQAACDLQAELKAKLAPFITAGWNHFGDSVVVRELVCDRISVTCNKDGNFELFFFCLTKQLSFDSAEETLKYVAEVEKQVQAQR